MSRVRSRGVSQSSQVRFDVCHTNVAVSGWTLDCEYDVKGEGVGEPTEIPAYGSTGPLRAPRNAQGDYDVLQPEEVMAIYIVVEEGVKMLYTQLVLRRGPIYSEYGAYRHPPW